MYIQWRTPPVQHEMPARGLKSCLLLDEANCGEVLREDKVREHRNTVVTDRHALAAHEFWHRRTGGIWMDPVFVDAKSMGQRRYSSSGQLLSIERLAPDARPVLGVAVPGAVRVRLRFEAVDQVAVVDFVVLEVSHTEFEVSVVEEQRSLRPLPKRLEHKVYLSHKDYSKLQETLVETDRAVGRLRTLDIVGGCWMADLRQTARHELAPQARQQKAAHVQKILERRSRRSAVEAARREGREM
mmetsp:Transcript_15879/g.37514  ORF Transcript_15879/g.37514 Transcript_15879/m.37514 type:complete len:242 (-) Transcript_15879:6-731(-)